MYKLLTPLIFITILCSVVSAQQDTDSLYSPDQLEEDLDFLLQTFQQVHPNLYAFIEKTEFEAELRSVTESLNQPLSRLEFYRRIAPLVELLSDGHTFVTLPMDEYDEYSFNSGPLFPLDLEIHGDRLFIRANYTGDTLINAGLEVVSIDGIPSETIIDSLLRFITGMKRSFNIHALENSFRPLLWTVFNFDKTCTIEVIDVSSDQVKTYELKGVPLETIMTHEDYQAPDRPSKFYSYRSLPDKKTGIIDFRSFSLPEEFDNFLAKTFKRIHEEGISHLIIDIRKNGGGNSVLGGMLLSYITSNDFSQLKSTDIKASQQIIDMYGYDYKDTIGKTITYQSQPKQYPEREYEFEGDVYLLISPKTFSSAVMLAAAMKDHNLGTLIGEETGGLATSYGDVYSFNLPNTKLKAGVSHKRFVRPSGLDDGRGVLPDHEVSPALPANDSDNDRAMEYTFDLIEASR